MRVGFLSHLDMNLFLFRLPIMKELVKKGHRVFAITPKGDYFEKFAEFGVEAIEYKIDRGSLNPLSELKSIKNIYHSIRDLNLDILHSFTIKPNIYGLIASNFAKVPIKIATVTGLGSFYIDNSFKSKTIRAIIETLYRVTLKSANGVIFQNSDDLKYFSEKSIIEPERAFLVKSSGVDTKVFDRERFKDRVDSIRESLGFESDDTVVLMIARAIVHKGIREYIEVAKELKSERVKFLLVGEVDSGSRYSLTPEELESEESIIWLKERQDIDSLIAICDIFTLPSYREGVPRTLLEASAMSKPIVTTDAIGCREVVEDGLNGILVKIADSKSLKVAIVKLLEDRDLREKFGRNSRIKALKEFDVDIVVKRYLDIYYRFKEELESV